MEVHLLVINVGNSRMALGTFVAGELSHVQRISVDQRADWSAAIAEAWRSLAGHPHAAVAGSCVNSPLLEVVEHAVQTATGKSIAWAGASLSLPIRNRTDAPQHTGVDRLLNVAAAYEQMQKACVVVDAGTAMTVDLCNDAGEFLGGAIVPGASLMLRSLHERTAKLPLVTLAQPVDSWGKTTEEAIRHGVYHGLRGAVKELVEIYALKLGTWPEIIATGGDAKLLFDGWELIHAVSPDLTLYGIALAYVEHHAKSDR